MKVEYLGNQELLQLKKAVFLASSTISSETVLQVYDWATEMRNRGECVVSGFSSKLEQDVLHFLLKGSQPIIQREHHDQCERDAQNAFFHFASSFILRDHGTGT